MPKNLICPQCREPKVIYKLYLEEEGKFRLVNMCKECYNHHKKTKNLFRKTSAA